jgi:hypothetical protein
MCLGSSSAASTAARSVRRRVNIQRRINSDFFGLQLDSSGVGTSMTGVSRLREQAVRIGPRESPSPWRRTGQALPAMGDDRSSQIRPARKP